MKERIIIEDVDAIDEWYRTIAAFIDVDNNIYKAKFEQVPETFEELKELVRELIYEDFTNGVKMGQCVKIEYILIDGKSFMPDGEILDEDNDVFAKNRTPAQMWQIIKALVGDEKWKK